MTNRAKAKMQNFTGSFLCGEVTYKSNRAALRTFNFHCEDCKKCSGAPYLTNIFVKEASLDIQEDLKSYVHELASGNKITKEFYEQCGCQMLSFNKGGPELLRIHGGTANALKWLNHKETSGYQRRYSL